MKQDDAKRLILAEMRSRLPAVPYRGTDGGMLAFNQLRAERPDLFHFRSAVADPWQLVSAWMRSAGLVA
jgi:hypothetical protein